MVSLIPGLAFAATLVVASAAGAVQVVASIKPVHSLVAMVMEGTGTPALIVEGAGSPHTFALRPSDAKRIAGADVVVWVGPTLEGFLAKSISALPRRATVITLSAVPEVRTLVGREGGAWGGHSHGHAHAGAKRGEAEIDGHLWLDPANAGKIVEAVAVALAARDPAHAARYRANAAAAKERLASLDAELAQRLAPVAGAPFLVFHDAYQYLETRYGMRAVGAISISADRKPGARRIRELRQRISSANVRCVFSEPQFDATVVATVVEDSGARTAVLDPLGSAIVDGPNLYPLLMRGIADSIVGCLTPSS